MRSLHQCATRAAMLAVILLPACRSLPHGTTAATTREAWTTAPSMLHERAAHAVVSTGSAIYALAGTGAGYVPVLSVEKFDGKAWHEETTLPGDGLNAPAAAVIGDRIYLIGGFSTVTNVPVTTVRVYDTRTKQWSDAAPLPEPRGGHSAVVLDGRIHVIGGGNSKSTLNDHDVYDPATNSWHSLAPLPRSEGSPAGVVYHGKLYAIGGRSGLSDFGEVYVYDAEHDGWGITRSIPPRGTAGAAVYCGTLYVFGGESQPLHASLADVFRWNDARAAWDTAPPMPTGRNFARTVILNNAVYVVGGSPTPGPSHASVGSAIVERFSAKCAG